MSDKVDEDARQDFVSEDSVLLWIAHWLGRIQHRLNRLCYSPASSWFERLHGGPWIYFNYLYVFGLWVPVATAMYVASTWFHGGWWLVLALPLTWRWLEAVVWWAKLLLDRTHTNILAAERNLLFFAADGAVVVAASAVIWRTAESTPAPVSWVDAFSTFTLNGPPMGVEGWGAEAVAGVSAVTGLILLGGGLALLVGIVSQRVREVPGVYTGPRVPPPGPGRGA